MVFFRLRLRKKIESLDGGVLQASFLRDSLELYRLDPYVFLPYWVLFILCGLFFFLNGLSILSLFVNLFTVLHAVLSFYIFGRAYRVFVSKYY